jgi:hemerythrin superfamily protein
MADNVIDLLTADHHEVKGLLAEVMAAPTDQRREKLDAIIGQLVRHSVAEETIVYPVMVAELPDGQKAVDHDTNEHKELEVIMKQLESSADDALLQKLKEILDDHVSDEEDEQFPLLRSSLSEERLSAMGVQVEALKKIAPTRPHPAAPNNALFHLAVGPGVGLVDRLRDAISGRKSA